MKDFEFGKPNFSKIKKLTVRDRRKDAKTY